MKLHLGCGDKYWPGFVNVDLETGDVKSDVRKLPQEDGSASEIHAVHLFEHLYRWETAEVLKEWKRVLKPNGKLALELPCLDKILSLPDRKKQLYGLYGDPGYKNVWMTHKWCWSKDELKSELVSAGFDFVLFVEPYFHKPERDIRVECFKPSTT